ncbi:N-formylglutamate amidohydrolase [Kangiella sp. HZ709]|uniref:N-formylglutamate amidohydrolase n=1 Tax=Kangiella sp. HZ709 TaxID=2666328 RepID=UPI0012AF17C6|nr:N-formylglutamate amidohydrolase [Kangiella sp. HZ709]MRX27001.1 N-formylglutamate deformylase [Kangiella sp. HZ709]
MQIAKEEMMISQLIEKFEQQQFKGDDFHHLEHLKVAWHYICNESLSVAKEKFHNNVMALVKKLGAENKYHRTLTDFMLDYLFHLRAYLGSDCWQRLEEESLLIVKDAKKLISFYYSDKVIWSDKAKSTYLEPDILALDRASLKLTIEEPAVFKLTEYDSPLIVSIPHNGQLIPHYVLKTMLPSALDSRDTDWYLSQLYSFLDELEVTSIIANYSRYLIDLNRDSSGKALYKSADNTELCPTSTFDLEPLYQEDDQPDVKEIKIRMETYWQPYHQELQRQIRKAKDKFGYAILFEAHSIAQEVPRFFDGKLPDFNFGTNDGKTVDESLTKVLESFDIGHYSKVINARFKGGFITRHYAKPEENIFTIQLELSQANYLDQVKNQVLPEAATSLSAKLKELLAQLKEHSFET